MPFDVERLPLTDTVISTWAQLVGLAGVGFKTDKDRERDRLTINSNNSLDGPGQYKTVQRNAFIL